MLENDNKDLDKKEVFESEVEEINEPVENVEEPKAEEVKETVENIEEAKPVEAKAEACEKCKKPSFLDSLLATLIDQGIIGLVSFAGLFIFDAIIRATAGLYVNDKLGIFLIIYAIFNVLYPIIMESSKAGNTIGRTVSKIKSVKL